MMTGYTWPSPDPSSRTLCPTRTWLQSAQSNKQRAPYNKTARMSILLKWIFLYEVHDFMAKSITDNQLCNCMIWPFKYVRLWVTPVFSQCIPLSYLIMGRIWHKKIWIMGRIRSFRFFPIFTAAFTLFLTPARVLTMRDQFSYQVWALFNPYLIPKLTFLKILQL